ncbi:MAG: polyprenyl synthetase family protein [Bdellovibrionota bacterium]
MSLQYNYDIDPLLKQVVQQRLLKTSSYTPTNLSESISYSLLAPGKRIRARLSLACSEMLGLPYAAAVPAALSVEIMHCFTLIHDDLPCMDNADFRRGLPSNHKKFGEALALLAGDALMAMAFEELLEAANHIEPNRVLRAGKRLLSLTGPQGVIGGQAAEMLLTKKSQISDLRHMHELKTGALFKSSLLIPQDLAGIEEKSDQGMVIGTLAHALGLAFQVADDLADYPEDSKGDSRSPPTSILFYQSAKEAGHESTQALKAASDSLQAMWGDKSKALREIATQVLRALA